MYLMFRNYIDNVIINVVYFIKKISIKYSKNALLNAFKLWRYQNVNLFY